jgi:hypothetical protein
MTTKNPRLNVVLDKPLYATIKYLAQEEGISLDSCQVEKETVIILKIGHRKDVLVVKAKGSKTVFG